VTMECRRGSSLTESAAPAGRGRPEDYRRDCTSQWTGVLSLLIFVAGYALVIVEDRLGSHFRKCIPMIVAAGAVWTLASVAYGCVCPSVHGRNTQAAKHVDRRMPTGARFKPVMRTWTPRRTSGSVERAMAVLVVS
jgi:hypothetical protein